MKKLVLFVSLVAGAAATLMLGGASAATLVRPLDTTAPSPHAAFGYGMTMGDVNGDGKSDIIVSRDGGGPVDVFSGDGGSVLATLTAEGGISFGYALAAGDIDGDGKDEIAVSDQRIIAFGNDGQGRVYVFSGTGVLLFTLDAPAPQAGAAFGIGLAMGDVNGDGKDDIAVGVAEDVGILDGQGKVYVFSGMTHAPVLTLDNPDPQALSNFGGALAAGDANGDWKADIVVGAAFEDVGGNSDQGRAFVFSGATGALLYALDTPNPQANARFARYVAAADVSGDRRADFVVTAPLEDVDSRQDQGRAYVFSGSTGGLLYALTSARPQPVGIFGSSVAAGKSDGSALIAVGALAEEAGGNAFQGRTYVFSGLTGGLLAEVDAPNPEAFQEFGSSVGVGDADGDGVAEVAVGAEAEDVSGNEDQGRAYIFRAIEPAVGGLGLDQRDGPSDSGITVAWGTAVGGRVAAFALCATGIIALFAGLRRRAR